MRRDVLQAIADPTRRAIIALVALQVMTPNAIADNFNTTSSFKAFANFDRMRTCKARAKRTRDILLS